jgi:hypothetical protein
MNLVLRLPDDLKTGMRNVVTPIDLDQDAGQGLGRG